VNEVLVEPLNIKLMFWPPAQLAGARFAFAVNNVAGRAVTSGIVNVVGVGAGTVTCPVLLLGPHNELPANDATIG